MIDDHPASNPVDDTSIPPGQFICVDGYKTNRQCKVTNGLEIGPSLRDLINQNLMKLG